MRERQKRKEYHMWEEEDCRLQWWWTKTVTGAKSMLPELPSRWCLASKDFNLYSSSTFESHLNLLLKILESSKALWYLHATINTFLGIKILMSFG